MIALLALALVLMGVGAAGWGVWAVFSRPSPTCWIATGVAPLGILIALVGAVLFFVPGFFG